MKRKLLTCLLLTGLLATAASALAGTMDLTRSGALYQVALVDEGLTLSWTEADGSSFSSLIPQSYSALADSFQMDVDESTNTVFVIWQVEDESSARIKLATLHQGTWLGPVTLAGDDGTLALNPQLLIHQETAKVIPDDEEQEPFDITTTFLHVVWWSKLDGADVGVAKYMGIPLSEDGAPQFEATSQIRIGDLLPYGIGCHGIEDAAELAFPRIFVDPETGSISVFATDYANCIFQVVELASEVIDWNAPEKRGRHSIIVGYTNVIAINSDLPLSSAKAEMGRGLSVVVYWDVDDAIQYSLLDSDGWTAVHTLELSPALDHEQAVNLIQRLTR